MVCQGVSLCPANRQLLCNKDMSTVDKSLPVLWLLLNGSVTASRPPDQGLPQELLKTLSQTHHLMLPMQACWSAGHGTMSCRAYCSAAAAAASCFSCSSWLPAILMAMSSMRLPVGASVDLTGLKVRRIVLAADCNTTPCCCAWPKVIERS